MSKSIHIGRPRSETSHAAILDAAFAVLVARGYGGFTIEAVAAQAGAGKTTIYRWWPTKAELAVDAFFRATEAELRFPDTGSTEDDFRAQITDLAKLLRGERGRALAAMLGGARTDLDLERALLERWLKPRRAWGLAKMTKAKKAGELRMGVKPEMALSVLYSPLYTPLLFGADVPSANDVAAYLNIACAGIFVRTKPE